jgi:hypothetical protein
MIGNVMLLSQESMHKCHFALQELIIYRDLEDLSSPTYVALSKAESPQALQRWGD